MDTEVLFKLLNDYDANLHIQSNDDMLVISINEYLTLYAAEANEMLGINAGGHHWHMESQEMADFIIDILKGNTIIIEHISMLAKTVSSDSRLKILSKDKYEKIKHRYIGKKKVRIYSGYSIIQRAD
ncbi:MAG: hypothetical protein CVU96_00395 [Firmicutes bacterium HGW-Firmicutes-20]|jgi:hypothetical protein|nr:MAG: hypothetical protein CVU96_00395 [Firmicutes bacterium HGW-Firmicutes-20]PKM69998.1 MAG: hypothetical protein CVU94_01410 [Firmicutes bacterium HGW-Firmicutes-19]